MVQESTKMDTLIDPSGDTLRTWMGIGEGIFYGDFGIAVMTMSFCFPGVT
jgi:uracil-DNA glycosylase